MHNALAHPRLHHPKVRIIGIYAPDGPASLPSKTSSAQDDENPAPAPKKTAGTGAVHSDACVHVPNPKGAHFKTIGKADSLGRVWLLPEEALYLLERGSLDIRWPRSLTGEDGDEASELPMSLQAAYTCFIGRGGLTVERYSVFSGLRRLGYVIVRAPGWYDWEEGEQPLSTAAQKRQWSGTTRLFEKFWDWFYSSNSTAAGPVTGLGIFRSYGEFISTCVNYHLTLVDAIYRRLAIVPWYDPVTLKPPQRANPPFRVIFHIYKPSTPFKKSAPPDPDFRIAVINAQKQPSIPTLSQLSALLESTPLDPPRGEKMERQLYMRLRHGYRNVILAVVDQGVVSYLRVGDAAFGKEKLYAQRGGPHSKKGRFPQKKPNGQ